MTAIRARAAVPECASSTCTEVSAPGGRPSASPSQRSVTSSMRSGMVPPGRTRSSPARTASRVAMPSADAVANTCETTIQPFRGAAQPVPVAAAWM
ncbi:hypothetical protein [Nocardia wallacei]|uniref:hypothetical protein n=1 Tax=Nocardia wallacei TaxID=480035 RepID=UPI0024555922|nr:hypothetical protein [Nocardia wallacei]